MTPLTRLMCGVILVTVPTIAYGGYFLLTILSGKAKFSLTEFQQSMFRAGHAHAGVLVILSLIVQPLIDYAGGGTNLFLRIGFPLAAILVSGGFFASASGKELTRPNRFILILYLGILLLAVCTVMLGVKLINSRSL